jgi:hypothetical protein
MADGVHAAVDAVQPPAVEPPLDPAPFQAKGAQLRHRDHAVLTLGERRHSQIPGSAKKCMTVMGFLAHPRNRRAGPGPDPSSMTVFSQFRREVALR